MSGGEEDGPRDAGPMPPRPKSQDFIASDMDLLAELRAGMLDVPTSIVSSATLELLRRVLADEEIALSPRQASSLLAACDDISAELEHQNSNITEMMRVMLSLEINLKHDPRNHPPLFVDHILAIFNEHAGMVSNWRQLAKDVRAKLEALGHGQYPPEEEGEA